MMDFNTPPAREPQYIPRAPKPKPSAAPAPQPQATRSVPQPSSEHYSVTPVYAPKKAKKLKRRKSGWLLKSLVVVSLILITVSGFLAYNYNNTKKQLEQATTTSVVGSSESDKLINEISKTVELPTGETPTLSTLQNIKAQSSNDYLKVQNGDKVLVYNNAGVAVFYRPSLKKVIFFTYLKSDNSTSNSQPTNTTNNTNNSDTIQTNRPGQTSTQQP